MSLWDRDQTSLQTVPEVVSLLRRSVALDSTFVDAHLQLGIFYSDKRRYGEAIKEFLCAITLQPNLSTAHYHLAQAYMRTGEKLEAQQEFQTFQRLRNLDTEEAQKEQTELKQFVVSMKGQPATSLGR